MAIPYFEQPSFGPIHAFGVFVGVAVLVGTHVAPRRAVHEGLDAEIASRLAIWVLVGALIGSHLAFCLVYHPAETLRNPLLILKFWEGMSSYGGVAGAIIGIAAFSRQESWRDLTVPEHWRYIDAIAYAFVMGWIVGRAGCTVAFDHPGLETDFFLGWRYRDGRVIHNLGFYEMLYLIALACLFKLLGRRPRQWGPGFFAGLLAMLYAPARFGFDFLRTADIDYLGLTPGQWASIAAMLAGMWVIRLSSRHARIYSPLQVDPVADARNRSALALPKV